MPIYEYRCDSCGRVFSILTLRVGEEFARECRLCGSPSVKRLISRVHARLSEETRLERLADPALLRGLDENDPRSMARMLKKLGQEMGEDYPGEVDQLVEEALAEEAGPAQDREGAEEL